MTYHRPSRHVRHVHTRHGRRARLINPHLRRARPNRTSTRQRMIDAVYQQHLYDQAAREDRSPYATLPPIRRFVALHRPPPPKLPWYGVKVTMRKQRRWKPGRRRMRVPADVLDPRITRALEAGASIDDVQPMIVQQVKEEAQGDRRRAR